MARFGQNETNKRATKPCNVCQEPLTTNPERAIGVHIKCVAAQRFKTVNIPGPSYGARRTKSDRERGWPPD